MCLEEGTVWIMHTDGKQESVQLGFYRLHFCINTFNHSLSNRLQSAVANLTGLNNRDNLLMGITGKDFRLDRIVKVGLVLCTTNPAHQIQQIHKPGTLLFQTKSILT